MVHFFISNRFTFEGKTSNLKFKLFLDLITLLFAQKDNPYSYQLLNKLSCFFLSHIVSNQNYCSDMDKQTWLYLINFFTINFLNYQLGILAIDPLISIKCLRMIIEKCNLSTDSLATSEFYSFFKSAIANLK